MEKKNKTITKGTKQKFISQEQQEQIKRFFNNSKPSTTVSNTNEKFNQYK